MPLNFKQFIQQMSESVEAVNETAYEANMDPKKPVFAQGVKGMKSKPFTKKFKSHEHYNKWADTEDAENHEVHRVYQEAVEVDDEDEDEDDEDNCKTGKFIIHKGDDDASKVRESYELDEEIQLDEELTLYCEAMIERGDFMDKVRQYKAAGINVLDHKHSDNKAHIVTVDKEGIKRKINFKPSGTSLENLGPATEGEAGIKKADAAPAVKRGRGRPAGSASGARRDYGSGERAQFGGIATHSLNLPGRK